jgi:two-component system LytT family response regulator
MLRAVIVDDEMSNREILTAMLNNFFPGRVEVLALCDSVKTALVEINDKNPDVLFLDIEMPTDNSFSLIEKTKDRKYDVVFVTAYSHYAVEAFKVNAIDYLLKPLSKEDLGRALDKLEKNKKNDSFNSQEKLLQKIAAFSASSKTKIGLPTLSGTIFIDVHDIIHCQADGSYCVPSFR